MLTPLRHSVRLTFIGWTLARHDALIGIEQLAVPAPLRWLLKCIAKPKSPLRQGQRLSLALQALGPSFIKIGQALSTRADLIGEAIAQDLTSLQDHVPPFATALARATVEEQLGAPIATLFQSFDDMPIAAASIAQVHFAVTTEGKHVAVKILRPGVEQQFDRDIALMFFIARMIERRMPQYRRFKSVAVVETFANTIRLETDLRFEAAAAEELRANSRDDPDFYVPEVDWNRTARRVLVTEHIDGIHAGDLDALAAAGISPDATMEKAAKAFFNQVFRDGFFHADMHPGNLFVLPDGRLAPVDFGIMGRLDRKSQRYLAEIMWCFMKADYLRVAELHREAGYIPRHVNLEQFAQACRAVGAPIAGKPINEISAARMLGQVLAIASMFEMETQPQLLLLQKTMMTAEGVGRMLNPTVNMWQLSEPLIRDWAKKHLSPRARTREYLRDGLGVLRDAPRVLRQAKEFLDQVETSGLPIALPPRDKTRIEALRNLTRVGWVVVALLLLLLWQGRGQAVDSQQESVVIASESLG